MVPKKAKKVKIREEYSVKLDKNLLMVQRKMEKKRKKKQKNQLKKKNNQMLMEMRMMRVKRKLVLMVKRKRRRKRVSQIKYHSIYLHLFSSKIEKKAKPSYGTRAQDNSEIRNLGNWSAEGDWKQNVDYTIPVVKQYPNLIFPEGEFQNHPGDFNLKRTSGAEYRAKDKLFAS